MDGFKEAVSKLEQLQAGGFIAADEFDRRKKELVDKYVGAAPGAGGMMAAAGAGGGFEDAGAGVFSVLFCLNFNWLPVRSSLGKSFTWLKARELYDKARELYDTEQNSSGLKRRPQGQAWCYFAAQIFKSVLRQFRSLASINPTVASCAPSWGYVFL